ncbi:MAG: long-chain-fatty acid--ACP ligase MbtM, partial [Mycobacterium sp.]
MANPLASALAESLTAGGNNLVLLTDGQWIRHPWPEIYARAENTAEYLLNEDVRCLGLVGEPTAELISAVIGAFLAGTAVSILPGPIRGADTNRWAQATQARFRGIAAGRVGSQGAHLEKLFTAGESPDIFDLTTVAHPKRSSSLRLPSLQAPV